MDAARPSGRLPPLSRRHLIVAMTFAAAFLAAFLAVRLHVVLPFGGR